MITFKLLLLVLLHHDYLSRKHIGIIISNMYISLLQLITSQILKQDFVEYIVFIFSHKKHMSICIHEEHLAKMRCKILEAISL